MGAKTVAFPTISTGGYRWPLEVPDPEVRSLPHPSRRDGRPRPVLLRPRRGLRPAAVRRRPALGTSGTAVGAKHLIFVV
ncbi:hypothetical protein [Streptomyces roseoverticillatus]|uniref:hypothetical protein n=1 Tax=Streptomyces roseoverticillatus TaxID=66429 RepID=UPI003F557300